MGMDLHTHSRYSDGTAAPRELVLQAKENGVTLFALTDHDTIAGVPEALEAGAENGVSVLAGVELDTESPFELHLLGLGVSLGETALREALREVRQRRQARNEVICEKLHGAGIDLQDCLPEEQGVSTRLHIAMALRREGYAETISEAFHKYLGPGCVAYAAMPRLWPDEAISLIHEAGGVAVLAHPCHIRDNPHQVVSTLAQAGLGGLEAYYPGSTAGQTALFVSLARQYGLFVTCGSDTHGANRPGVEVGCAYEDVQALRQTDALLRERFL